jgi:hypothetical protein
MESVKLSQYSGYRRVVVVRFPAWTQFIIFRTASGRTLVSAAYWSIGTFGDFMGLMRPEF